ncbi:MAG: hypothetical protein JW940_03435 [Polyangiaceae bacterium]|nr:hypothetical protein [Polyangiaceae bacterium]
MKRMRRAWIATSGLLSVLVACGDPIHPAQVIEKARVLAARAEVQTDPERATPEPGEEATARWLVVSPGKMPRLGWTLVACEPTPVATGANECGHKPLATSRVDPDDVSMPELSFTVPEQYRGSAVLVAGILCFGGTPPEVDDMLRVWPRASGCDGGRGQAVTFEVTAEQNEEASNLNPSLQDDRFELHGQPWLVPPSPIDAACAESAGGAELPLVSRASKKLEVRYVSEGSDREPTGDGSGESLLLASFSTGGKLERTFTVIEWKGAGSKPETRVDWTLPGHVSETGDLVRFHFVTRDSRGGADWTERAVCVVP